MNRWSEMNAMNVSCESSSTFYPLTLPVSRAVVNCLRVIILFVEVPTEAAFIAGVLIIFLTFHVGFLYNSFSFRESFLASAFISNYNYIV